MPGWRRLRQRVLERDNFTCQKCGAPATVADHVRSVNQGGTNILTNLQALCNVCNRKKGG